MKLVIFTITIVVLFSGTTLNAQWVQTNGPSGCSVSSFATNAAYIFTSPCSGGVYRSTDNGMHWNLVGLVDIPVYVLYA